MSVGQEELAFGSDHGCLEQALVVGDLGLAGEAAAVVELGAGRDAILGRGVLAAVFAQVIKGFLPLRGGHVAGRRVGIATLLVVDLVVADGGLRGQCICQRDHDRVGAGGALVQVLGQLCLLGQPLARAQCTGVGICRAAAACVVEAVGRDRQQRARRSVAAGPLAAEQAIGRAACAGRCIGAELQIDVDGVGLQQAVADGDIVAHAAACACLLGMGAQPFAIQRRGGHGGHGGRVQGPVARGEAATRSGAVDIDGYGRAVAALAHHGAADALAAQLQHQGAGIGALVGIYRHSTDDAVGAGVACALAGADAHNAVIGNAQLARAGAGCAGLARGGIHSLIAQIVVGAGQCTDLCRPLVGGGENALQRCRRCGRGIQQIGQTVNVAGDQSGFR